jgi:folylpolyglutamate synthase/dihydropteroate synthase
LDILQHLQLLSILSFHAFIEEEVDVAIYETYCSGGFGATNIIRMPAWLLLNGRATNAGLPNSKRP